MKTTASHAGLLPLTIALATVLTAPAPAADAARYVGAVDRNPEKNTFGVVQEETAGERPRLGSNARWIGALRNDPEKATFAFTFDGTPRHEP